MRTKIKLQKMNFDKMYFYDKKCKEVGVNILNLRNWTPVIFSAFSRNIYISGRKEARPCGVRITLRDKSDLFIIRLPLPYK